MNVDVETTPFKIDENGIAHIGGTRVTLDTIICTFLEGATAEEIAQRYPVLDLADVYSTIGYYLHNRNEVHGYLKQGRERSRDLQMENEKRFDPSGVRERLLARQGNR